MEDDVITRTKDNTMCTIKIFMKVEGVAEEMGVSVKDALTLSGPAFSVVRLAGGGGGGREGHRLGCQKSTLQSTD